jgi:hypothetical protein
VSLRVSPLAPSVLSRFASSQFLFLRLVPLCRWSHRPLSAARPSVLWSLFRRCQPRVTGAAQLGRSLSRTRAQRYSDLTNPITLSRSLAHTAGTQRISGTKRMARVELNEVNTHLYKPIVLFWRDLVKTIHNKCSSEWHRKSTAPQLPDRIEREIFPTVYQCVGVCLWHLVNVTTILHKSIQVVWAI